MMRIATTKAYNSALNTALATLIFLMLGFYASIASAVTYSDAESGTDGWQVYDKTPAGASISRVYDAALQSQVIQTLGDGRSNGYLLGGTTENTGWNNTTDPVFRWKMATSESFVLQVYINTTSGLRRLNYTQSNSNLLKNPKNNSIHFGLGSAIRDGAWRTHTRNLAEDVSTGEPGNTLVGVYGVVVLGSLRIDDVELLSNTQPPGADTPPVAALSVTPSRGEAPLNVQANASGSSDDISIANYAFRFGDGTQSSGTSPVVNHVFSSPGIYAVTTTVTDSAGQSDTAIRSITVNPPSTQSTTYTNGENTGDWVVLDNRPSGATITSVFDNNAGSRVIRTNGNGRRNTYLLGGTSTATGWNNRSDFNFTWDMATEEPFVVQVFVETQLGTRRLTYNQSNSNLLANPSNNRIHYGLGSAVIGAGWLTHQRNLAEDVRTGEPQNRLLAVNGVVIAGSLLIDNIALSTGTIEPPVDTPPNAEIDASTLTGNVPLTVTFGAASSTAVAPATITQYDWNFGNNTLASTSTASATYTEAGTYSIRLTVTDNNGEQDTTSVSITVNDSDPGPPGVDTEAADAARLLAQATFGATLPEIQRVRALGIASWVDDQLNQQSGSHLDYFSTYFPGRISLSGPRQHKWMIDAIEAPDQLRHRVAFALSQIFVTSDVTQVLRREQFAMTNYYDLLRNNAFGNYRQLLEEVTLSPIMGLYLSMLQNAPGDPATNSRADENYAREVMQLFSIGLYRLNNDGTVQYGTNDRPIPAYTQTDIEEYARIYTGWSYAGTDRWDRVPASGSNSNKILPMEPFPGFHDSSQKTLLRGAVSPAGISAEADLKNALDSIFNHPNVGPFFSKALIKKLVTSNPTPAYVARVASVFNNNGQGVRGDLASVIRAILLDTEARTGHRTVSNFGKLREPLLRWTHLWRAFNVQRGVQSSNGIYNHGSPYIYNGGEFLGQGVLSASSVFNFYHADYAPLGPIRDQNLLAPEAEIYSDAYILTTTSKLSELSQRYWHGASENDRNQSHLDISDEISIASNTNALLDRLDLLLLSGQMSAGLRSILQDHLNALPNDEQGRSQRVRDGITLVMASPEYLVQK